MAFTVEQPPTLSGISPSSGQVGNWPITITGAGFGATQSSSAVTFYGDIPAQVVSWSDTQIQVVVPAGTSNGPVSVQVGGLTAEGPSFQLTNLVQMTDSLGNQTNYNLAVNGGAWGLSSSQGPACSTCTVRGNTQETVDANGNLLTYTDDLGHTTSYGYDSNNNVTSVAQQLNPNTPVTTSYTYNTFGEVLTVTDPLGKVTTNTYDTKGNLLSVTSPAPNSNTPASVTQFGYDTKGELTTITDPLSNPTTLTYTSAGLIASITDAQNHITSYQYDARGNRTAVIDPINGTAHPTTFVYDNMNRLTGITYPDGSSVSFAYDDRGRRTSVTDQNQRTTTYTYDDADRLTAVTDPANNTTYYAYDTEDNLVSITDANNHTTNFAYNARGWVTQTTFPSTLYEAYGYDAVGNLTSKTDRKNQTIQYVYDALNRLTQKSYPDSTSVNYLYDLASKVAQVNDPTGVYGFAYDNMGRLIGTTTQYTFLPNQAFTNSYTYDAASNRKSLTAPDGSITTYGYDSMNRLNGLANSWAGSFGFGYDALSRRTSLTRPNGVNTTYNYDSLSRLLSVLHETGSVTLDGAGYTYDAAGNRASKTNYLNGTTSNYTYDPLYELTQVTQGGSTMESYSYDAVGNRLSSLGMPVYQYNASNQLTSNSLGSYTYDANGNTLSDGQGRSFTWDFENRLVQAVAPGTGTVAFKYDPFGRRIQKSSPLGTTNYLYDGNNSIEELDQSGTVLARYAQGAGIDQPLSQIRAGTTSYYNADGLGSITSLTSPTGEVAKTYVYDAFGNLSASTGTLTNSLQYTSREFDSETKLSFYRARYFDPQSGRFINEDPTGFDGGINVYSYAENSPVMLSDPYGLCTKQPCSVEVPLDSELRKVIDTMLGETTRNYAIGTNQYADDQQGHNAVGDPQGPVITEDTLNLEAYLIASTIVNRANDRQTDWAQEVTKRAQYAGYSKNGAHLKEAMRSSEGSDLCTQLQRMLNALTEASRNPEPGLTDYKAVVQGRRPFVRSIDGARRVAGTDFQY